MSQKLPSWLGSLYTLEDCNGDSEKYLEEDRERSRRYFNHAQRLFDNWYMMTKKHDYKVGWRLDNLSEIFDPPNSPRPWF